MNIAKKVEVEGVQLLRVPFEPHHISKLPKPTKTQTDAVKADYKKGIRCTVCGAWHHPDVVHLDYVGHAALTDRLLDADINWSWEPVAFDQHGLPARDGNGGLWIRLTVDGVTRLGYGSADGKSGGDAIKEIIGDALRNAAMRFGAALDLWHKGELHPDMPETGGHSQEDAVSPPHHQDEEAETRSQPDTTKGWREQGSIYSTPSKLHAAVNALSRDLTGCGDSDMVYGVMATAEWKEFERVSEIHMPHYLYGGKPAPEEFEGLKLMAARLIHEFDHATGSHMAALATA